MLGWWTPSGPRRPKRVGTGHPHGCNSLHGLWQRLESPWPVASNLQRPWESRKLRTSTGRASASLVDPGLSEKQGCHSTFARLSRRKPGRTFHPMSVLPKWASSRLAIWQLPIDLRIFSLHKLQLLHGTRGTFVDKEILILGCCVVVL